MKKIFSVFALFLLFPACCMSEGIYGSLLRYVDTAPFILVNKRCLTLSLVDENGNPTREYGISCGINYGNKQHPGDNRTPEGIFHICQFLNSRGIPHDFGDGKGLIHDAYGPWFLRLDVSGYIGIGIHGTHLPESIGTRATEGCIRLKNEDLLDLKDRINLGTPVIILPDPFPDEGMSGEPDIIGLSDHDVFISYSRKDTDVVDRICKALDNVGITYFVDHSGIKGGMDIPQLLAVAIRQSKVFLFLGSQNSEKDIFTRSEISFAHKEKQKNQLVSYIIDDSNPFSITSDIDMWRNSDVPVERLVQIIQVVLSPFSRWRVSWPSSVPVR